MISLLWNMSILLMVGVSHNPFQSSSLRKSLKGLLCSLISSSREANINCIKVYEHLETSLSLQLWTHRDFPKPSAMNTQRLPSSLQCPALLFIQPRSYPVSLTFLPPGSSIGRFLSRRVHLKCVFQMCLAPQIFRETLSGNLRSLKVTDNLYRIFFY